VEVLDAGRSVVGVHFCQEESPGELGAAVGILMAFPSFRAVGRAGLDSLASEKAVV
jgi:hypothetical protein